MHTDDLIEVLVKMNNHVLKKLILLFLGAALIALSPGCDEDPFDLGSNAPTGLREQNAQLVIDTLYATLDANYPLDRTLSTLQSSRLLLGTLNQGPANFTFRPIMRFSNFPDSLQIDSAWIMLVTDEATGDNPQSFTATAYPVINEWIADTSDVWDDYQGNVDFSQPLGELNVTTSREDTLILTFSPDGMNIVRQWPDTSNAVDNNGLILDFSAASFIKEFKARNVDENIGPKLIYTYRDANDSTLIDTMLVVADAFLVEGDYSLTGDRLYSTTIIPHVMLLEFNIDTLNQLYPEGVIVETANLQLTIDWANTVNNRDFGPNLQLWPLKSELTSPAIEVDSQAISSNILTVNLTRFSEDSLTAETTSGDERQQLARLYVQEKLNNPDSFTGYYLEPIIKSSFLAAYAYYRYNDPDRSKRPRLIIQSTRLPKERF